MLTSLRGRPSTPGFLQTKGLQYLVPHLLMACVVVAGVQLLVGRGGTRREGETHRKIWTMTAKNSWGWARAQVPPNRDPATNMFAFDVLFLCFCPCFHVHFPPDLAVELTFFIPPVYVAFRVNSTSLHCRVYCHISPPLPINFCSVMKLFALVSRTERNNLIHSLNGNTASELVVAAINTGGKDPLGDHSYLHIPTCMHTLSCYPNYVW